MDVVLVGPADRVIAERHRLGLDLMDEVWDGTYHVAPAPSREHQRVVGELLVLWHAPVREAGLAISHELNLLRPDADDWTDYRVPDLVVFDPAVSDERGVVGPAELVVEVRSPGDESLAKLPFFERLGVREVLVVDRDTKAVRRWVLASGVLEEQAPDEAGRHRLGCLPVALAAHQHQLVVEVDGRTTRI